MQGVVSNTLPFCSSGVLGWVTLLRPREATGQPGSLRESASSVH